jgi:tetratricopeptide (TPR) repeat protein
MGMKKGRIIAGGMLAIFLILAALFIVIQNHPGIGSKFAWRIDEVSAYVRGVFTPRGGVPVAQAAGGDQPISGLFLPGGVKSVDNGSSPTSSASLSVKPIPSKVTLTPPEFDLKRDIQDWNNCGPATLALALRMYGWKGDQYDIAKMIKPLQTDKNVNPEEMVSYAEQTQLGLTAVVRVNGSAQTLQRLLAEGIPVIVEESFKLEQAFWPGDDLWSAHYLLITGYDQETGEWITQDSYYGPNRRIRMSLLEQTWKPFNRLMMVIYTSQQVETVKAILGQDWNTGTNFLGAAERSRREVQSNQNDAFAWFNLGSSLLGMGDAAGAADAFAQARRVGLPQRMLRYEFGPLEAALQTGNADDLFLLSNYALERTPNSEEALTYKGWAYWMMKQVDHAEKSFKTALDVHPGYGPALDGLTATSNY